MFDFSEIKRVKLLHRLFNYEILKGSARRERPADPRLDVRARRPDHERHDREWLASVIVPFAKKNS